MGNSFWKNDYTKIFGQDMNKELDKFWPGAQIL